MVFLVGAPGSGKSTLGRRVCTELGPRFVDLVDDGSTNAALEELV
jgi:shikimate kinase